MCVCVTFGRFSDGVAEVVGMDPGNMVSVGAMKDREGKVVTPQGTG